MISRLVALGEQAPRPAIRLVVNEELLEDDVRALIETGDTSALEEALLKRFKTPRDLLEKQRLAMLHTLADALLLLAMTLGGGLAVIISWTEIMEPGSSCRGSPWVRGRPPPKA